MPKADPNRLYNTQMKKDFFSRGSDRTGSSGSYVYEPMMWYKTASDYGASDMTGNVREWSLPGEPRSVLP